MEYLEQVEVFPTKATRPTHSIEGLRKYLQEERGEAVTSRLRVVTIWEESSLTPNRTYRYVFVY
jgi:hypothetical protein